MTNGQELNFSSKGEQVAKALRELILSGELPPGSPLRQRDLAERFRVSPTPVREALRRLESEGLAAYDLHKGSTVSDLHIANLQETFQIRALLEGFAAGLAAPKMTERDIAEVDQLRLALRRRNLDAQQVEALNRSFHFRIYETTNSPLLLALMRVLWQSLPGGPQVARQRAVSNREHLEIVDALRARDADAAADATRRHILGAITFRSRTGAR